MLEGAVGEYAGEVFGAGGEEAVRGCCGWGGETLLEEGWAEGRHE